MMDRRVAILLESAEDYARIAHEGQERKYTGEPYWHHLQEVAGILRKYGASPDIIAAGWLHDTIEDTKVSYQNLAIVFGHLIADHVISVTDVSRKDSGNTPEGIGNRALRKAIDRQYLAGASWQGQMIKCADIISNTKNIMEHCPGFAKVYIPENRLLIEVLQRVRTVNYSIWLAAYDQILKAEQKLKEGMT